MLSLNDIDQWDPAAITTVFRSAIDRAHGARTASAALGDMMAFLGWDGDTAEAARAATHRTMLDLDSHAEACEAIGRAAAKAAEEVVAIKARLQAIRDSAAAQQLTIDDHSATVLPPPAVWSAPIDEQHRILDVAVELTDRVTQLLHDAQLADEDLAGAIRGADGDLPVDKLDAGPFGMPVPPPAADPGAVSAWWHGLSPAEQDTVKDWSPDEIRNLDGIPALVRDSLNRAALPRELQRLRDGWLDGAGRWHTDPAKLADLAALADTLREHPELALLLLDTTGNPDGVLAAVAAGDVDTATRLGVTVGGMNTTVRGSVGGMAVEAIAQRNLAIRLRDLERVPDPGSVASIAWLGYRTPGATLDVTSDRLARIGAGPLNSFYRGLDAAGIAGDRHITALGHSYGSLTTSLALQLGAPVDDVVLYGSPGAGITDAAQLGVAAGHAFFEDASNDAVPLLAQTHRFGPPLAEVPGLIELSTRPGVGLDGWHAGAYGHSEYARLGPDATLRMSGYNLAAVLAGLPADTVGGGATSRTTGTGSPGRG